MWMCEQRFRCWLMVVVGFLFILLPHPSDARSKQPRESIATKPTVIDYQEHLPDCFTKRTRARTQYVIVHTSEGGLSSTLRTLSHGKFRGNRRSSYGGHANYAIARNGDIYRILHHRYRADHAGMSMWNGRTDLSSVSIGIELVGYHYGEITDAQYRSLHWLLQVMQQTYRIPDKNVLTHAQVAYAKPNRWFHGDHRGRKRCAKNFDRAKAGLKDHWDHDPDVRAGRLQPDPQLAQIFYAPQPPRIEAVQSNAITLSNTAWNIAGEDYNAATTLYVFPDGKSMFGDEVEQKLGWRRIPAGTRVMLNVETEQRIEAGPFMVLEQGKTAWSLAGTNYRRATTFYFFPDGRVLQGNRVSDWDNLPLRTRMILGYSGPYVLKKGDHPKRLIGSRYMNPETLYLYPDKQLLAANEITNWNALPVGTRVFVKRD